MKNIFNLTLLAATIFAAPVFAQNTPQFTWNRVNVGGGGMNAGILVHPAVPDLIYARQDVSGLLRWNPTAKKWEQLLDWMPASWWNSKGCAGFAVDTTAGNDAKRQNTIYAALGNWQNSSQASAAGNGVFRSFDRGATWSKIWDGTITTMGNYKVYSFASNTGARTAGENLAVDPFNPDVLWVGTNNDGLWISFDARGDKPTFCSSRKLAQRLLEHGVRGQRHPRNHD